MLELLEACAVCAWLVAPFAAWAWELATESKKGGRAAK